MSLVPIKHYHSNILDHFDYYPPYYNFYKRPYYWDDSILWRYPSYLHYPMDELIVKRIRNQLIRSPLHNWSYPMRWDNHYYGEHVHMDERGFRIDIDIYPYKPHEIQVITDNDYIIIKGQHSQKTPDGKHMIERNLTRRYLLPRGLKQSDVVSDLSSRGILTIKALPSTLANK